MEILIKPLLKSFPEFEFDFVEGPYKVREVYVNDEKSKEKFPNREEYY